ncbi:MAG: DUF3048 domain-containing protein [Oscillospiraceae bacterium]|jgi:hypothetical protein|nr:DUF3048 domain-containing protein [Oscillospiraceae bacterium]
MKKLIIFLAAALTLLSACKKSGEPAEPEPTATPTMPPIVVITPTPSPTPTPEPTPTPSAPYTGPRNPLSGLPIAEELVAARPMAVMINNRKIAQPQLGVSKADIIFEVPVEGGITRMLAVFQDASDAGVIGSVRSARPYYVDLAQAFDAVYIHAGGSPGAYQILASRGITHLDGVNGKKQDIFYRDSDRQKNMGYEHSMVTTGERIAKYLPTYGFRLEHEAGYAPPLKFEEDYAFAGKEPAGAIKVVFSSAKSTSLTYDDASGEYLASQHGGEWKDGNDGARVAFANALVLKTAINVIKGDSEGRLTVNLTGDGDGYLAIGGTYAPIKWSKAGAAEPFVFTDAAGAEITLRAGHTYVAIISNSASVEFSEAAR